MKSLFQVKVMDHTFVTFEDYRTAFAVARKVRQAYRLQNRAERVPCDVFKRQDAPGFMLEN
jgi:hypothetical protein